MQTEPVPLMWRDPAAPPNSPPLGVFVREQSQRNAKVSDESGFDCFDNLLVLEVQPGVQAKSTVCIEIERKLPDGSTVVNQYNYRKYKTVVDDFKNGSQGVGTGTPLHFLPGMDAARISSLKAQGVHWVESLAEMPDSSQGDLMGFHMLKQEAQKFIALREKAAPLLKMEAIEKDLRAENERLQRQLNDLIERLGEPEEKPRRSRPPKAEQEAA